MMPKRSEGKRKGRFVVVVDATCRGRGGWMTSMASCGRAPRCLHKVMLGFIWDLILTGQSWFVGCWLHVLPYFATDRCTLRPLLMARVRKRMRWRISGGMMVCRVEIEDAGL